MKSEKGATLRQRRVFEIKERWKRKEEWSVGNREEGTRKVGRRRESTEKREGKVRNKMKVKEEDKEDTMLQLQRECLVCNRAKNQGQSCVCYGKALTTFTFFLFFSSFFHVHIPA